MFVLGRLLHSVEKSWSQRGSWSALVFYPAVARSLHLRLCPEASVCCVSSCRRQLPCPSAPAGVCGPEASAAACTWTRHVPGNDQSWVLGLALLHGQVASRAFSVMRGWMRFSLGTGGEGSVSVEDSVPTSALS